MDLARDLFTVSCASEWPTDDEMVSAVEGLGYGATVQADGAVTPQLNPPPPDDGNPMPPLVQDALDQAGRDGKLVLVDFYADWCVPCKQMLDQSFTDARVEAEMERFVFLKVDTDAHPEVSKHFGVAGIPDVLILTADGQQVTRFLDFRTADELLAILQAAKQP